MESKYILNVPHKGKMLLIEGIIDINFDENEILTFSNIKEDNIFYDHCENSDDEGIESYIFTEYVAQTSAAYNGALNNSNDSNRVGFILNIKKVNCYINRVKSDSRVYIFVKEVLKDSNIAYYDGEIIISNDDINSLEEYKKIVNYKNKVMDCSIMVMESSSENLING